MLRTIGLMSGTSLDGVDAAWLETDGERIGRFGPTLTLPYDDRLRADLRRILDHAPSLTPDDRRLKSAEARLTEYHVRAVAALGREADLIGFHGQTILHQPDRRRTWQIGDARELAWRTGLPVAYDFRSADVAAGGQGAPLAPVYHVALASDAAKPLAVLNIGGVANVTWIGADGEPIAFDTGPGNALLDDWMMRRTRTAFDRDGSLARSGRVDTALLGRLLADPYFSRPAPKSLDRLDFAALIATSGLDRLSPADGAATLVAFTAASVASAPLPAPPLRWLVTGGGRHNPAIMAALRDQLGVPVEPVEAMGWNGDALEAQCFGFLAARSRAGLPISYPDTTGAPHPMTGGRIIDPKRGSARGEHAATGEAH
jgi:anhydro-N-acetylmuramic acid kinase